MCSQHSATESGPLCADADKPVLKLVLAFCRINLGEWHTPREIYPGQLEWHARWRAAVERLAREGALGKSGLEVEVLGDTVRIRLPRRGGRDAA